MIKTHCDYCDSVIEGHLHTLEGNQHVCKMCLENIFGLIECVECGHLNDEDENICEKCSLPIYK